ncbi:hypothetical protein QEH59_05775 [Coraliomargarita sp. SDUM461004]|uniref:DUF11 domain-containing protein n=1 Tax=Thalassobacterium sedimentorum TaxID=3041258 RepID=A0ABU1AIC5_9BACT|nr:hypothetical protein [Coraliomargarita sp. SDUM461004]MDQ8193923.1 hypothetical protein [Coraliomargarita sp. SDUM461004]
MNTSDGILKSFGRIRTLALSSVALLAALSLSAAAPTAGTKIGNQASATYKDQNGTERDTTSNTVVTTVLQIPGLALTQDNTRSVSPGGSVFLPHTLTNTGNGTDSFDLYTDTVAGDFTLGTLLIYADTNQDGEPDDITSPITTTGDLTPGEQFYFVVGTSVPGSANDAESASFNINGGSDYSQTLAGTDPLYDLTDNNTDTINVSEDAVMTVSKLIDTAQGIPGTSPVMYTLSYNNTGNKAATSFTMTDEIPEGMTYIAGTGRSSLTGTTVLTDASGDQQAGGGTTVDYEYDATEEELVIIIDSVPAGASGTVTFQVGVDAGLAPQIINNVVQYTYDPDGPGVKGPVPPVETNRPPFEVLPVPAVSLAGETLPTARPGETVTFTNVLTNNGTSEDTFDMSFVAGSSTYPTGTTFRFYLEDGNTPMVDTNGNSTPDTGPIAVDGIYNVIVKATLPTNISGLTTGNGPYSITKRATGTVLDVSGNPATADANDIVTTILPPNVDITNAAAGDDPDGVAGEGDGAGADGITKAGDPGSIVTFPLTVENEGTIQDAYNLTVDPASVPAGWVVNLRRVAAGAVVNNSGTLNPPVDSAPTTDGGRFSYVAEVTIPEGETPGDREIIFLATSPTSGVSDFITNTVTVNTVREITLVSDNAGQVSPGGAIVYEHVLTNMGNISEMLGASNIALTLSDSKAAEGWTSIIYRDSNGNGVLDTGAGGDTVIDSASGSLAVELTRTGTANDSTLIFVKVFAPLGAPNGAINISTLTATTTGEVDGVAAPAAVSNEDTTTVILGDLELLKEQALDADNDGEADGGESSYTTLPLEAKPGASILYRITATNTGSADATDIVIYDTTPTATKYYPANGNDSIAAVTGDGSLQSVDSQPGANSAGSFEFSIGTLAPGDSAVASFGVKIDE